MKLSSYFSRKLFPFWWMRPSRKARRFYRIQHVDIWEHVTDDGVHVSVTAFQRDPSLNFTWVSWPSLKFNPFTQAVVNFDHRSSAPWRKLTRAQGAYDKKAW